MNREIFSFGPNLEVYYVTKATARHPRDSREQARHWRREQAREVDAAALDPGVFAGITPCGRHGQQRTRPSPHCCWAVCHTPRCWRETRLQPLAQQQWRRELVAILAWKVSFVLVAGAGINWRAHCVITKSGNVVKNHNLCVHIVTTARNKRCTLRGI